MKALRESIEKDFKANTGKLLHPAPWKQKASQAPRGQARFSAMPFLARVPVRCHRPTHLHLLVCII